MSIKNHTKTIMILIPSRQSLRYKCKSLSLESQYSFIANESRCNSIEIDEQKSTVYRCGGLQNQLVIIYK